MYRIEEIRAGFGAIVKGIQLSTIDFSDEFVRNLKEDLIRHRLLLFRGQGKVSGERQVELSRKLGRIESTFYKHPKSPHPDIFRVSNDEEEGCTGVGRSGWHVDGTFQEKPFKYQTMHFHSVCKGGETHFVPLKEVYDLQPPEIQSRWDKLWMLTERGPSHPLVYKHPHQGETTLLFHCGRSFCKAWAVEDDDKNITSVIPSYVIQDELTDACQTALEKIGIKLDWEEGDFAINDNLGNAHYATPGTQIDASRAGLRILHRTTIAGEEVPTKTDGRSHV